MQAQAPFPLAGEIYSLLAALTWALAFVLFKRSGESVPPVALNLLKNVLGLALFSVTLVAAQGAHWKSAPASDVVLLCLSGIIGITVADTLLFAGLNRLGAGLAAVVDCIYAPATVLLAFLYLGERISLFDALGACLIISGIVIGAGGVHEHAAASRRRIASGVLFTATAVVLMGIGIVMVKPILNTSPVLWVTWVRLAAGTAALAGFAGLSPSARGAFRHLRPAASWKWSVPASVLGTYVSMLLWIAGMKFTFVSVAAILNQMSVIFIILLAVPILKEPLSTRKILSVALGISGALVVNLW